jgi:alkylated DNA nucleotide flippase Atl1
MSGVDMVLAERILDVVASVPAGRVSTYGDIAALAGTPSPRLVGRVLAELSDDETPWHRVVRADGPPAPPLVVRPCELLRPAGVRSIAGRVNLRRYRWRG